ncbi:MAG TPA: hypothetical protein VF549_05835 [Solirubrobacteraceae bacterium]
MGHRAFRLLLLVFALGLLGAPTVAAHGLEEHGDPRQALPDRLVTQPVAEAEVAGLEPATPDSAGPGLPETWCGTPTTTDDVAHAAQPADAHVLKLVYAYPTDEPNRFAQLADRLQADASLLSRFVALQSGGRRAPRWETGTSCGPQYVDIQLVALPRTRAAYLAGGGPDFDLLASDLDPVVSGQPGPRNWVVYADAIYDATAGVAGTATLWGDDRKSATVHDAGRQFAMVFGPRTLSSTPYAWPSVMLHEIAHNLGAVQWTAPHSSHYGHCTDGADVMCYADGPGVTMTYPCAYIAGVIDETLDCGGDDYFNPTPALDSYLDRSWNVYDSAHLGICTTELADACGASSDGTPPTDTTPVKGTTAWTTGPYTVGLRGEDAESPVDGFAWKADGGPIHYEATATLTTARTLATRVRDAAGNWSRWRTQDVNVDSVVPRMQLDCPSGTFPGTVTCSAQGSDEYGPPKLEAEVDGRAVSVRDDGTGRWQIPVVRETAGDSVVRVRAVDRAGNASDWQQATMRIEPGAPDVTLERCDDGWKERPACVVHVTATVSPVASVRWRVDDGPWRSTSDGEALVPDQHGRHTILAEATDSTGRVGTERRELLADTSAPVLTVTCPAGFRAGPVECTAEASDPESGITTLRAKVDGAAELDVPVDGRIALTGDRDHTVDVVAVSGALGSTSATREVRFDTAPPVASAECPDGWAAAAATAACTVTATDAGSGLDRIEREVGGVALSSSTASPARLEASADGETVVRYRAVDRAGNATPWVERTIRRDTVDPAVSVECPEGWRVAAVTCVVKADDATSGLATLSWRVGDGAAESGPSGSEVVVSAHGAHTVTGVAVDGAGRRREVSATARVDLTAPVGGVACPAGWRREAVDCALTFSDPESGVAERRVRVDGAATPGAHVAEEGEHRVEAQAVNGVGAASGWAAATARVDLTAPSATLSCPDGWSDSAPVSCEASGSDALSGIAGWEYEVGGAGASSLSVSAEGATVVRARPRDAAGNMGEWRSGTARIDRVAPEARLSCAPAAGATYSCTAAASDAGSGLASVVLVRDGSAGDEVVPGAPFDVEAPAEVAVRATDALGHATTSTPVTLAVPPPPGEEAAPPSSGRDDTTPPAGGDTTSPSGDDPAPPSGDTTPPSDDTAPTSGDTSPGDDPAPRPASFPGDSAPLRPAGALAPERATLRTSRGRPVATATVAPLDGGVAVVELVSAKLARGTYRFRACAGNRCATRTIRLTRARRPKPLTVRLKAASGARVRLVLERRDAHGRFRADARAAATIV